MGDAFIEHAGERGAEDDLGKVVAGLRHLRAGGVEACLRGGELVGRAMTFFDEGLGRVEFNLAGADEGLRFGKHSRQRIGKFGVGKMAVGVGKSHIKWRFTADLIVAIPFAITGKSCGFTER